ncbi:hypothetical protein EON82_03870 [bacterium]|nr:MAG: hypothetical protein EON82_03870 [bacterium]
MAGLRSLLGGGDKRIVEELSQSMDKSRLDERGRSQYREALSRAIMDGAPFSDVQTEKEAHVLLASHLARYGQRHRRIDCGIPMEILQDFLEEQGTLLRDGKKLIRFLVAGRPLFGLRIGAGKAYGYLLHEETLALRQSLERFRTHLKAEDEWIELAEELTQCLDQGLAQSKHPDLWIAIG